MFVASGGRTVPSEVDLSYYDGMSYESLILKWKAAEKQPCKYEITIWQKVNDGDDIPDERSLTAEPNETTKIVDRLRPLTTYYCMIVAKYLNEPDGSPVSSNSVETEDRKDQFLLFK